MKWFVVSDGALGRTRLAVDLLVGSRYGVNLRVVDKSVDDIIRIATCHVLVV